MSVDLIWKRVVRIVGRVRILIITGCGHSGIVNTLNYAMELTGEDRIYAVIGGMHLSGGVFESIISRTVDELEKHKPRFIIPCHCTGLKAVNEIVRRMPSSLIHNSCRHHHLFLLAIRPISCTIVKKILQIFDCMCQKILFPYCYN